MLIKIKQHKHFKNHYISKLYIDGVYFCYVLQDTLRAKGIKVYGETAIPLGEALVDIRFSGNFNRECLVIYTRKVVKNGITEYYYEKDGISFMYILLHGGNRDKDTLGCPLVAYKLLGRDGVDGIQSTAEKALFERVAPVIRTGKEVKIKIS